MAAPKILVINGPNLDMLGVREPAIYGTSTLVDLERLVYDYAGRRGIIADFFQSNSEAAIIDAIHRSPENYAGIVYNPGAHAHYSYALREAVAAIDIPVVEVHISDTNSREAFRRVSVIAPACVACVKGLGFEGYCRAVDVFCENEILERLGEGYEERYPLDQPIIIGTPGKGAAPAVDDASSQLPAASDDPASDAADVGAQVVDAVPAAAAIADAAAGAADVPIDCSIEGAPDADPQEMFDALDVDDDEFAVSPGLVSFERQTLLNDVCSQMGIDAFLVRDTSNIKWLTAFEGVFDEERAHALLVRPSGSVIHTDSRYAHALRSKAADVSSDIIVNDANVAHARFVAEALALSSGSFSGQLGVEDTITYDEFVRMAQELDMQSLVPTKDIVVGLRAVKDADEIARLRAAQAITDAAFRYIVSFMKPGMTERDVQIELEHFMLRHGAEDLAFRSIVAAGANGADPHAIPGATRLEAGQCVVMDFGAKARGYCSDMTRVVFLGQPDERMAQAWRTLREANEAVERMLAPGVTGKQAQELAEQVLEQGGFGGTMGHGLGHGVGIDVHEQPLLNRRNEAQLVAGNVVTVEPGIYLPGEFGMRLEDFGVVTETGFDVFTQSTHDMVII